MGRCMASEQLGRYGWAHMGGKTTAHVHGAWIVPRALPRQQRTKAKPGAHACTRGGPSFIEPGALERAQNRPRSVSIQLRGSP